MTGAAPTFLDAAVPRWDFDEEHARRVDATAQAADDAIWALTPADMPLARMLMALRGLRRRQDRPFVDGFRAAGFSLLGHRRGREIALGGVGRPWRLRGEILPSPQEPAAFRAFEPEGCVKIGFDFRLAGDAPTTVTTRTRIAATDEAALRRFRRYWLLVRPGSGLIRRSLLAGIARRAEGGAP
jgi:hypothetical protein